MAAQKSSDDPVAAAIQAAMDLAATRGWRNLSLAGIAAAAGLSTIDLYEACGSRQGIIRAMIRRADRHMLATATIDHEDSPKDRLLELLMRRLDALSPWRAGIRAVLRDLPRDPVTLLCAAPAGMHGLGWALDAAGLGAPGPAGVLRTKGLAVVWLATLRVWIHDDDPDQARSMAALDRNISRAEKWCGLCRPRSGGQEAPAPA